MESELPQHLLLAAGDRTGIGSEYRLFPFGDVPTATGRLLVASPSLQTLPKATLPIPFLQQSLETELASGLPIEEVEGAVAAVAMKAVSHSLRYRATVHAPYNRLFPRPLLWQQRSVMRIEEEVDPLSFDVSGYLQEWRRSGFNVPEHSRWVSPNMDGSKEPLA